MPLPDHFDQEDHEHEHYRWHLHEAVLEDGDVHQVARSLVEAFMEDRCPGLVEAWRERRDDGPPHPESRRKALESIIKQPFDLPPPDEEPSDHVQGAVAEHLWYYLYHQIRDDIAYSVEPELDPTSGGGDSISVHQSEDGLSFRLWEIKKCTAQRLRPTVSRALNQLDERGSQYIAQMSMIGQKHPDEEIAQLFIRLPELWCDYSPEASVGVSVGIPERLTPDECFTDFPDRFPDRSDLRGMVKVVGDYTRFVRAVQEEAWSGL